MAGGFTVTVGLGSTTRLLVVVGGGGVVVVGGGSVVGSRVGVVVTAPVVCGSDAATGDGFEPGRNTMMPTVTSMMASATAPATATMVRVRLLGSGAKSSS